LAAALGIFLFALAAGALSACNLVDPLPDQRSLPTRAPSIEQDNVFPSPSQPVLQWPDQFLVPVRVYNPTVPFEWRVFIDYDSILGPNAPPIMHQSVAGSPTAADLQTQQVIIAPDGFQGACHRIDFVTALAFDSNRGANGTGADSVTWFYAPAGNFTGCSLYDGGGNDGAFPDAGVDASDARSP